MKVLVLGGTGAMGVHLVQLLSKNGVETVVTSRSARKTDGNIKYIQGDAHDLDFLQVILKEHWDAIVDFMTYDTMGFKIRTDLLLKSTNQYIFLSSARVYADSMKPITELSPRLLDVSIDKEFLTTDEYSLTKARQENILYNSGYKNWTIIRPYITYSENRLQLGVFEKEEWLYRALHGRTIVFSEDINSKITNLTYGLDVSKGIFAVICNNGALNEVINIAINEPIVWKDVLNIYLDVLEKYLGNRPRVLLTNLNSLIEVHPAKYQVVYDRLFNRQFDCSKLSKYVEISSFTSTGIGLRSCLEDFLKNRKFNEINWQLEARKDKQTNERTSLKEIRGIKQKIKYLIYRSF